MTRPFLLLTTLALLTPSARAQVVPFPPTIINNVGGVYVEQDGTVKARQTDTTGDLAAHRLRARAANQPVAKDGVLTYVSIPRALAEVRERTAAGKEIPDPLKYLGGITQIRYLFVYAGGPGDLVIAGPSEPFDAKNTWQPTGKLTGRPVLHVDDLVNAFRYAMSNRGSGGGGGGGGGRGGRGGARQMFGCAIDPHPDSLERSNQVMKEHANATRKARMDAMKQALGPQTLRFFGAPPDTRFAFVTLAADYKMKRMILGVDAPPVPGLGNGVDNTRAAANLFCFVADYQPLLVSPDGDAYEIRGQRLRLNAGPLDMDPKGVTESSKTYAKNFTAKFEKLATLTPAFADLQNVSDLALIATLIRRDKLDRKTGVDFDWWLSPENYKVLNIPTPRTAETLVNYTNGSIVAGGVSLHFAPVVTNREEDKSATLAPKKSKPGTDNWYTTK